MSPKRGRPRIDNPRNEDINIRITKDEKKLIEECAEYLGTSRTDAIMEGIKRIKAEKDGK